MYPKALRINVIKNKIILLERNSSSTFTHNIIDSIFDSSNGQHNNQRHSSCNRSKGWYLRYKLKGEKRHFIIQYWYNKLEIKFYKWHNYKET